MAAGTHRRRKQQEITVKQLTRRQLIQAGMMAGALAALAPVAVAATGNTGRRFAEYRALDATGLAALVRSGEADPLELLEIAIARTREVNPLINAVVAEHFELARQAVAAGLPGGPFRGVPYLLKDLGVALAGTITTHGSRFFSAGPAAPEDDTLVQRLKSAGLVIFGKTLSPEFGSSPSSEGLLFGATRNPWNLELSAGGSSGGAAAAVAAGIIPAAHASDGGGSIRIPASACGLFGLKPTRGRVPMGPAIYESRNGLAAQHAVTRSVRDSAALLDAEAGAAAGDPYGAPAQQRPYLEEVERDPGRLRIALLRQPPQPVPVDSECLAALEDTARLCAQLGHQVEEAILPLDVEAVAEASGMASAIVVAEKVADREAQLGRPLEPTELEQANRELLAASRQVSGVAYAQSRRVLHQGSRAMAAFMARVDLILSPTMALLPPAIGVLRLDQSLADFSPPAVRASVYTSIYNATGQPAMSVPLYWTGSGIPVGTMFAARFGDEATLFRLAGQLERARPWFDRVPPL